MNQHMNEKTTDAFLISVRVVGVKIVIVNCFTEIYDKGNIE